jgi:hypothetical protein
MKDLLEKAQKDFGFQSFSLLGFKSFDLANTDFGVN